MAAPSRRTDRSLANSLTDRGHDFEFFQAVHLLARLRSKGESRAAVANEAAECEPVHFEAHASMSFPASQIHEIAKKENGNYRMSVAFLGLTGPQGILPAHYTEFVLERLAGKDKALCAFLDIFNHRLLSLFYRAWEKHHFLVGYERERAGRFGADRFTNYLFALIGMGTDSLRNRLPLDDLGLLRYTGLLAQRPHSASGLGAILSDYFQISVEVTEFRGAWLPLEESTLAWLDVPGLHNQLGVGAVAGDAVWDLQSQFRVRIGPVAWERFAEFLPDRPAFHTFGALTRYYCGDTLAFDVQIILQASQVPRCCLQDEAADAPRLGWSAWLKTDEFLHDASEPVFEPCLQQPV